MMQIVPKGIKWTSGFQGCGGGYLASNHIGLTGLTRFAKVASSASEADLATAVNIRFQRGRHIVSNILAADRHGASQLLCPWVAITPIL